MTYVVILTSKHSTKEKPKNDIDGLGYLSQRLGIVGL
jgi:hypothetical protein